MSNDTIPQSIRICDVSRLDHATVVVEGETLRVIEEYSVVWDAAGRFWCRRDHLQRAEDQNVPLERDELRVNELPAVEGLGEFGDRVGEVDIETGDTVGLWNELCCGLAQCDEAVVGSGHDSSLRCEDGGSSSTGSVGEGDSVAPKATLRAEGGDR